MSIANKLKKLREQKDYTKEFMASQLKVSIYTYKAYEWGTRTPTAKSISELSDILECTTDDILKG
jgi:DNA-binding XRE family transcriptional regulator